MSLTTGTDNDWIIAAGRGYTSVNSNAFARFGEGGVNTCGGSYCVFDTNSNQTPAGSHSMAINFSGTAAYIYAAFKPAPIPPAPAKFGFFNFFWW